MEQGGRLAPSFILLHVGTRIFQHYLLMILSFLQCAHLVSLSKKKWLKLCGPISRFSLSTHWSSCLLFVPTPCCFGVAFCNHALSQEVTGKVSEFQCSLLLHEGSPLFSITQYSLPKSQGHKEEHTETCRMIKGRQFYVLQEQHLTQLSRLPVGGSVS